MDEDLRAPSGDLQAAAAFVNDVLSVLIIICAHNGRSTGQHRDLQHVPGTLRFGSEGAVQQQLVPVRCKVDGIRI
eukprot:4565827-Amphidinium_carterae.1